MASGYNDTLSTVFDPGTYCMSGDPGSFLCNRAGMLLGGALACSPQKLAANGTKAVAGVAARELAGVATSTVITKAEVALTRSVTNTVTRNATAATAQKTTQAAEQYIIKSGVVKSATNPLKQLGVKDGFNTTTSNALDIAEKYLGPRYRDLGNGRFSSLNGLTASAFGRCRYFRQTW